MASSDNVGQWNGVGLRHPQDGAGLRREVSWLPRGERRGSLLGWAGPRVGGSSGAQARGLLGRRLQLAREVCRAGCPSFRTFGVCVSAGLPPPWQSGWRRPRGRQAGFGSGQTCTQGSLTAPVGHQFSGEAKALLKGQGRPSRQTWARLPPGTPRRHSPASFRTQ